MSIESSNIEQRIVSVEGIVKRWLKCRTKGVPCSRAPKKESSLDKGSLLEGSIDFRGGVLSNLGDDSGFINEKYYLCWYETYLYWYQASPESKALKSGWGIPSPLRLCRRNQISVLGVVVLWWSTLKRDMEEHKNICTYATKIPART